MEAVRKQVTELSLNLRGVKGNAELMKLFLERMKQEAPNQHAMPVLATRTFEYYKAKVDVKEVLGDKKAVARQKAFEDLRNPLSLCAALGSLQGQFQPEHFHSSDDVAILLNEWQRPRVITTKEAQEILAQRNIGVSTTEEEQKRRVATFNITISGDGSVLCSVIQLCDRNFENMKEEPIIYKMKPGLYILLYHPSLNKTVLAAHMYRMCILRCARERRAAAIKRDIDGLAGAQVTLTQSSSSSAPSAPVAVPHSTTTQEHEEFPHTYANVDVDEDAPPPVPPPPPPARTEDEVRARHRCIVLACDGAYPQINAILSTLVPYCLKIALFLWFLKYAGGCSLTQSVNDAGKFHSIFHMLFGSSSFRYTEEYADPEGSHWQELKTFLKKTLDGSSFNTYWRCLAHSEMFIEKAFIKMSVRKAYQMVGVFPYNPKQILSVCPAFHNMSPEDAEFTLATLPQLTQACQQRGYVREELFEELYRPVPGISLPPPKLTGKQLNEMATSRQRAMIVNNPNYLAELENREPADPPPPAPQATTAAASSSATGVGNAPARAQRTYKCGNSGGCNVRSADLTGWVRCGAKKCQIKFCNKPECFEVCTRHRELCGK